MMPHFDSCYIISYNDSTLNWFYTVKTIVYLSQKNKQKKNITKQKKQHLAVDQRIACNLLVNVTLKSHFIKGA